MRSLQDRNWTDWETVDLFDDNCVHQKWPKIFIAKKRWNHLSRIQLEGWRAGFRQVYCGVRLNHGELRRKYGETKFEDCRDAIIAVAKKAGFAGNKPSDMWPCCTNPDKLASWNSHAPLYELHARAGELAEDFASWMLGIAEATWQEIDHLHNA